jgi:predicted dehydrogenase
MMPLSSDVSVVLVGAGGYGNIYLASLLNAVHLNKNLNENINENGVNLRLIATVDPNPSSCKYLDELNRQQLPIYSTMEEMYTRHSPELVILCSPPHVHCEQTVKALKWGSHVLCEKPLCTTLQQAHAMIQARDQACRQVAVGYQWSFSQAIQDLKRDVISGELGKPRGFRTLVLWPRDEVYYRRNAWAGKRYAASSKPLFDSPLNNACAHHLHNLLYVLGDRLDRSAIPETVVAELYRVNEIETFDTCAVRVTTREDVEALYIVSHATEAPCGPMFHLEFDKATVVFYVAQPTDSSQDGAAICARFHDGRVKNYGSPDCDPHRKLWVTGASVRSGQPTACGIEAAMAQTMVMAAVHESVPEAVDFPPSLVRSSGERGRQKRWVEGLDRVLINAYEQGRLPHELGIPWAVAGETVSLGDLPQINSLKVCLRGMSRVHIPSRTNVLPQVAAATIVSPVSP